MKKLAVIFLAAALLLAGCARIRIESDTEDETKIKEETGVQTEGIAGGTEPTAGPTEPMGTEPVTAQLRFDGMYSRLVYTEEGVLDYNQVLRFYEDGTMIASSYSCTGNRVYFPEQSLFDKDNESFRGQRGEYTITGNEITFTTVSENGTVDYWGTVEAGRLILNSHSNINGFERFDAEYEFHPFGELEP